MNLSDMTYKKLVGCSVTLNVDGLCVYSHYINSEDDFIRCKRCLDRAKSSLIIRVVGVNNLNVETVIYEKLTEDSKWQKVAEFSNDVDYMVYKVKRLNRR